MRVKKSTTKKTTGSPNCNPKKHQHTLKQTYLITTARLITGHLKTNRGLNLALLLDKRPAYMAMLKIIAKRTIPYDRKNGTNTRNKIHHRETHKTT